MHSPDALATLSAPHAATIRALCALWAAADLTASLEYVREAGSADPIVCVRFADARDAAHGAQIARAAKRAGVAVDAANNNGDGTVTLYLVAVAS